MARSLSASRSCALAMIAALVLFPAVTRLRQIGVPQNPASFSGAHRSGVVPTSPELALPTDVGFFVRPEPATHPADRVEIPLETIVTAVLDSAGLRAPPFVLS